MKSESARIEQQPRKPRSYVCLKLSDRVTGMECRVTSAAKNGLIGRLDPKTMMIEQCQSENMALDTHFETL